MDRSGSSSQWVLPSVARRAIYVLYFVAFLDFIAVSLFYPLLNREIKKMGGSPFVIGLVSSTYGAIQLFSGPIVGHASDSYGRRKIFLIGIIASMFGYLLLGSAAALTGILLARIVAGCFKHTQTLGKTTLTDLAPNEKSLVLGYFNAFGNMGFIVGPTIGGHLVEYEGGFRNCCYLAALLFLLNMVLFTVFVPETAGRSAHEDYNQNSKDKEELLKKEYLSSGVEPQSRRTVIAILIIRFLFSFSTIVSRANLQLIMEAKFNTSVVSYGYLNSLQALVSTITGFTVGPVTSYIYNEENRKMVIHTGILQLISMACLYYAPTYQLAGLSLIIMSAINPFLRVSITSLSLTGSTKGGALLGLGQSSTSMSRMTGPLLAGISQQTISDDGPALLATIASSLGCLCVVLFVRRPPSTPTKPRSKSGFIHHGVI